MRSLVACLASLAAIAVGVVAVEELKIEFIVTKQCDRKSKNGDTISVNYNGTLTNGEAFDSSYDGKGGSDPFSFTIGRGEVIKGWEVGLLDMCVGDQRKLTLPPEYAYGNRAIGPIPANSTLIFFTELMGIKESTGGHVHRT